ncbi:rhamnogalacturonan acetylesterase [Metabacillus malikii]|uniref:rhamnogalacturonan acetylesterase n=1 Tax=Metabacillus malikii TaxID=1504265 RepID=UPI003521B8F7
MPTIYLAGDSTVENISTDRQTTQQGWGQQLPTFFKEDIKIINKAMGGRSTKSFINEGRLLDIIESIQKNDYLFIQFGHNDQKLEDPSRGTEPWSTYQMYLTLFIEAAREKGATPILVTPVNRRSFENGKLINSLGDYPKAMRELAANLHVPLIDLFEKSRTLYEILGEENTKQLFIWYEQQHNDTPPDNTHFGEHGAKIIAELVIDGILELELDICQYLINEELKVN